jgi:hypothetical protein
MEWFQGAEYMVRTKLEQGVVEFNLGSEGMGGWGVLDAARSTFVP